MTVDVANDCIYTTADSRIHVHSLVDGRHVRSFGEHGAGPGQFHFLVGGVCVTPTGTLLVAEHGNGRIQEVTVTGEHVRFFAAPAAQRVHCNGDVVVYSARACADVTVLSMANGDVVSTLRGGELSTAYGLRVLADGSGVVVAHDNAVGVYDWTGARVQTMFVGGCWDVCEVDGSALVALQYDPGQLLTVDRRTGATVDVTKGGDGGGYTAVAVVPSRHGGGGGVLQLGVVSSISAGLVFFNG